MNSYKVDASSTKDNSETFLVSFPVPPKKIDDLSFDLYAPIMESTFKKRKVLVAEAGKIEYVGDSTDSQYNCKYAIGILDKTTNKIKLHNATALSMQTIVKKLKNKETRTIGVKDYQARNQLGQAFGTRKRKQAIKAQEQNVVNISGLADVAGAIKDTIAMNAPAQPLKAALLEQSMQDRLIPPCNINVSIQSSLNDFWKIPLQKI
jgi:DNA-directed RNA polymerase I subunit RPA49